MFRDFELVLPGHESDGNPKQDDQKHEEHSVEHESVGSVHTRNWHAEPQMRSPFVRPRNQCAAERPVRAAR